MAGGPAHPSHDKLASSTVPCSPESGPLLDDFANIGTGTLVALGRLMLAASPSSRGFSRAELLMAVSLFALGAIGVTVIARPSLANDSNPIQERAAPIVAAASEWRASKEAGCPTVGVLISEGYLSSEVPREDPWGGVFRVFCQNSQLFVHSDGADQKPGSSDDVNVTVE